MPRYDTDPHNAHPLTGVVPPAEPPKFTMTPMGDDEVRRLTGAAFRHLAMVVDGTRNNATAGNLGDLMGAIRATTRTVKNSYAGPINDIARSRLLEDAQELVRSLQTNEVAA